jgi:hypothetical protein
MRKLLCVALLAACELQPAPKQQPAPPAPTPPEPVPAKPVEPPPPPVVDAGPPRIEITADCMQVGSKIAQVFIESAKDAGQKAIFEQERANMTRKTGEACTTQGWNEAARKCYLATRTPAEIKTCEKKHTPPPTAPAPPAAAPTAPAPRAETPPAPAGSGSAPKPEPQPKMPEPKAKTPAKP